MQEKMIAEINKQIEKKQEEHAEQGQKIKVLTETPLAENQELQKIVEEQ